MATYNKKNIEDVAVAGKTVLVRCDLNMKENAFSKALMKVFYATRALPGVLWTIYLVKTGNTGFIWTVVDITSAIPTFVNVFVVLLLSGQYFKLLKDYKARYMGVGKVDSNTKLFYED